MREDSMEVSMSEKADAEMSDPVDEPPYSPGDTVLGQNSRRFEVVDLPEAKQLELAIAASLLEAQKSRTAAPASSHAGGAGKERQPPTQYPNQQAQLQGLKEGSSTPIGPLSRRAPGDVQMQEASRRCPKQETSERMYPTQETSERMYPQRSPDGLIQEECPANATVRDQLVRLAAEGKEEAEELHKYSVKHCEDLFEELLYVNNIPHPVNPDSQAMLAKKVYANLVFALSLVLSSIELDLRGPSGDHLVKLCTLAREIYNYNNKIRRHALPRGFFAFLAAYGPVHLREKESRALEGQFRNLTNYRYRQEGTTACTRLLFFMKGITKRQIVKLKRDKKKWEAKLIGASCRKWTVDMEIPSLPWCFDGRSVTPLKPSDDAQSESEDEEEAPRLLPLPLPAPAESDSEDEGEVCSADLPPPNPPSTRRSSARVWK